MALEILILVCFFTLLSSDYVSGVQILSKSKLEKCEKTSDSYNLNCTKKIVLNMAVPSGSSGGEASIVAEVVEVEENSTSKMQTIRIPPVLTVNKTAVYALYELTYIRDVPYKPQEFYVKTRKCEPDASAKVVKICERLRDEEGHIIEHTQLNGVYISRKMKDEAMFIFIRPKCCPCGPLRRMPSSCGKFFDKMMRGKANTAHCLRFPGDWFHVFGIGQRSLGFNIRVQVKTGSKIMDVVLGPENRTVSSSDNFLRVNLIGDLVGYTNIPSLEDFYLVIPKQDVHGQPPLNLGRNFSMWMLLERVRFTLDGFECNKIGVGYEAFNGQPNFCASPFWSCLHNQLWNFWEADQNRINRNQLPLYGVEGRFERINQHPNAGTYSFSIGITEVLNTNLLIELRADDVEYVYQRSDGKILSISVPTFEALSQFGVATITTKNIGEVEASYSLTFDCSRDVTLTEEQYFIMKPKENTDHSFKLYLTTDQAAKYVCSALLKDADFNEVDRAECQFSTTATVLDNGSQITPFQPPKDGITGFFESIKILWDKLWESIIDFTTGRACRRQCSRFFDFRCHIQYICLTWLLMFGLLSATFPTVLVLMWLLHQKGFFDPLYDWLEDHFWTDNESVWDTRTHGKHVPQHHIHANKYHKRIHKHMDRYKRRKSHDIHRHKHSEADLNHNYYLHHVHRDNKNKRGRGLIKSSNSIPQIDDNIWHHRHRKETRLHKDLA